MSANALDVHAVKTLLSSMPTIGAPTTDGGGGEPPVPSLSYTKMIAREMGKVEALVKVLLSPSDGLAETFKALLRHRERGRFPRALRTQGFKRNDVPNPRFGLFTAVGAPASSKPLADDLPAAPKQKIDVAAKMSSMFKSNPKP